MPYRTDLAYIYDGSIEGLMCCVFESFHKKELPSIVMTPDTEQFVIYETKEIHTDTKKFARVTSGIKAKLGSEAQYLIKMVYYSDDDEKELRILKFLHFAFKKGKSAVSMLSNKYTGPMHQITKTVSNESHFYLEFLRFSDYNGVLISIIEPKAFVLPLIIDHFKDRLPSENFLIFDKAHKYALLYSNGLHEIAPLDDLELPEASEEEVKYKLLWQMFYDTIAVEGRTNHKCRMNNMPKRFWGHMTEFERESSTIPQLPSFSTQKIR